MRTCIRCVHCANGSVRSSNRRRSSSSSIKSILWSIHNQQSTIHIQMRYIAAIDQGTTSTRCILFDREKIVAQAQREHEQIFPHPGWVEHDPIEIWHRTEEVVAQAIRTASVLSGEIAAIGIANQRETTVVWDKLTGQPLCNAIVWQDMRTKELCDALFE